MDVREKLVEILKQAPFDGKVLDEWWWEEKIKRIADHLINNGVTIQEWISVNSPPKERGEYLCYFKYEPESPDVICQNTYYGSGRWMSESGRVTHWAYLPQPPKGE